MKWLKKAKADSPVLDRPLTVWTLARMIADRRGYPERGLETHRRIRRWMTRGLYGVRLASWPALTTRLTTLRQYQDFRRKVARARRLHAAELAERLLQLRRGEKPRPAGPRLHSPSNRPSSR